MSDVMVPVRHTVTDDLGIVPSAAVEQWRAKGWEPVGPYIPPVVFDPNVDIISDGQAVVWNAALSRFRGAVVLTKTQSEAAFAPASGSLAYARPVSTDGTNGLPMPTGQGVELVITANGLQDIRMNGVSL